MASLDLERLPKNTVCKDKMMHSNNVSNFFYFVVVVLNADGKPEEKNKFEGGSSLWITRYAIQMI